jgi:hypothetical protein
MIIRWMLAPEIINIIYYTDQKKFNGVNECKIYSLRICFIEIN